MVIGEGLATRPGTGFAGMDGEAQRRLASLGGKAAHAKGTAHEWNSETAKAAGRRGGLMTQARRKARRQAEGA
jgi:general stress protein YciG